MNVAPMSRELRAKWFMHLTSLTRSAENSLLSGTFGITTQPSGEDVESALNGIHDDRIQSLPWYNELPIDVHSLPASLKLDECLARSAMCTVVHVALCFSYQLSEKT
jgi:hypothetical protein